MTVDLATASPIGLDGDYCWPHAERLLPTSEAVALLLGPPPIPATRPELEPALTSAPEPTAAPEPAAVEHPSPDAAAEHLAGSNGAPSTLGRRWTERHRRASTEHVARKIARAAAVTILAAIAWLVAWSALPRVLGWQPVLVVGGSMAPSIQRGDVVLVRPAPPTALGPGAVITFSDAGRHGELVTHRIVAILPDGQLRTRGDHNHDADPQPVPYTAVRGRAVLRLPWVGRPVIWLHERQWWRLGALAAAAATAITMAARPRNGAVPDRRRRPPP